MRDEMRRLHPRQYTDWTGEFAFKDEPDTWRPCRVVDVSSAGAGVQLEDVTAEEIEGRDIMVRLQLEGQVRHASDTGDRSAKAGMEFTEVTEQMRQYLATLSTLQIHW
jgi:PilZ domain